MPFSLAIFTASKHASAADCEIAGVIPVQWNHSTPSKALSQSTIPG